MVLYTITHYMVLYTMAFYFDLDGHFGLPCILNIYHGIYFYILFSFVPHGTPGLHHPASVRNADLAYEAIHYHRALGGLRGLPL